MTPGSRASPATQVGHLGPRRRANGSARSTRRSFARRRSCFRPSPTSTGRSAANTRASPTACTACRRSPTCRTRCRARRRACRARGAVGPHRDDVAAARADQAGRSRARDRCRLRSDAALLRPPPAAPRRRGHATTIRSLARAIEARVPAQHEARVHRVAGLADVRSAGRSARSPTSRMRAARWWCIDNTWATPLGFPRVRPRRRRVGARRDQVHRRPFRCAARGHRRPARRRIPPLHRLWTDMGVTASTDDCFLGLRGLRTLADAPRPAAGERACGSRNGCARGPEVAEVLYPALPGARGHELWKRDFAARRRCSAWCCSRSPRTRVAAMLDGLELFRHGLELGRLREPHHPDVSGARAHGDARGTRADRACALRSASRIPTI